MTWKNNFLITSLVLGLGLLVGCSTSTSKVSDVSHEYTSYASDVEFMRKYTGIVDLTAPDGMGRVAVSPALQGRVMTSSASGSKGRSLGWINRELFASEDTMEHINVYGGEERFWLGPEGGQYSIFFEKGADFNLDNWYTPRLIDQEPFEVEAQTPSSVVFTKKASLTNYSGFQFDLSIERKVDVLRTTEVFDELGIKTQGELGMVAYKTTNTLTNIGDQNWKKETGLLSIWLLGMFNHSPSTTIIIPFLPGSAEDLGSPVNDAYFGKVPEDRLVVKDSVLYFSGDGQYRSKIGVSPQRAKDVLGSYDAAIGILTIVKYNKPKGVTDYVNSMWEIQDQPYAGDVVNAYNDGPLEPGAKPLGPFYELETSSPALALKSGESGTHVQLTAHFEGDEKALDMIAQDVLGVTLEEITKGLKNTEQPKAETVSFTYSEVAGIGKDSVYNRRDPSDIIKVGGKYYVYYTRMNSPVRSGYWGTIWYATSEDEGYTWQEQGMALGLGETGAFDSHSVFTPNILVYDGKYYLYYTAVRPTPGNVEGKFEANSTNDFTAIGVAVADSPDGPFERLPNNPVIAHSEVASDFDSYRVDDASLLVRDGKIWLYYKGRCITHDKNGPKLTEMGVAVADAPEGPFEKKGSLLDRGHEVLIWKNGPGVSCLASLSKSINYADDGLHFSMQFDSLKNIPMAPGLYRPHLENGNPDIETPGWGISMTQGRGYAYLMRFEMDNRQ